MASNEPHFPDTGKGRKRVTSPSPTPSRSGFTLGATSQASLSSYFAAEPPPGTPAPPRFDPTQSQNLDEDPQEEPLSVYATEEDYGRAYIPKIDYLEPSIVPGEMHNKMDMNYVSWAIRHAITNRIGAVTTAQELAKNERMQTQVEVKKTAYDIRAISDRTKRHEKEMEDMRAALAQTIFPLIQKIEQTQELAMKRATKQFEELKTLLLSRPNPSPPPPPPALPAHVRAPAPIPARAQPARARPAQKVQQQPPQPQQQQLQQQQQQQQQQQTQHQSPRSFANVVRTNNPNQEAFQVVQRKKASKKPDPLFKADFSRTNREIIVECNAPSDQAPCNQTPSEIRTKINAGIPDAKCHFIAARKTINHNIVLETKYDTSAETALAYKHEIKDVLTAMRIYVIDIKANSKWSKFLLHSIPTTIGDGLDAGQLVASEIRNNYGEKFELAQIPRWITTPEKRLGKEHSSMIIAIPGSFTIQTLGLQSLLLFDRRCSLEAYLNIREDTQCRNCLEFGHRQEQCSNETGRCGHCAEDHTTDNHPCKSCPGGVKCTHSPIRCYNCKGFHKAIDRACPERAKATLKASLRFNESRPQKTASALINVAPVAPAPVVPVVPAPVVATSSAPNSTIQVPATPAPAPVANDHDMGNV